MIENGGLFISFKGDKEYSTYRTNFTTLMNNFDKLFLNSDKAKCFVFDATAAFDPDYQNKPYIEMVDCSKYNGNINLKINFVNTNTSRYKFNNNQSYIKAICETIKQFNARNGFEKMLIVSYKKLIDNKAFEYLKYDAKCKFGYFGNLKGTNEFMNYTRLSHVGLNRYSDIEYLMKYLSIYHDEYEKLKQMSIEESRAYINELIDISCGCYKNEKMNDIMMGFILADFEQNIFRTAIRKFNNEPVEIWALWSNTTYQQLNTMVMLKYSKLGVTFDECEPLELELYKAVKRESKNGKTKPQQALKFLNQKLNESQGFDISEFKNALGSISNQDVQAVKRNKGVKQLFDKFQKTSKTYYEMVG